MSTEARQQVIDEFDSADMIQYLTFKLDSESFATEIDNVREVLEYTKITRVPRTPEYMLGVINLRGSVVPVVDLRLQFDMPVTERTVDTCIVIIEVNINETSAVIGALVDSVQEVINLAPDQLSPPPSMGACISNEYVSSMGKTDERFVIVLDLDALFTIDAELFSSLADSNHSKRIELIKNTRFDEPSNDISEDDQHGNDLHSNDQQSNNKMTDSDETNVASNEADSEISEVSVDLDSGQLEP